jgi:hypothetical protein
MHGHPVQEIKGAKAKKLENGKSSLKTDAHRFPPALSFEAHRDRQEAGHPGTSGSRKGAFFCGAIKQDIVALLQDLANLPRTDLRPGLDGKIDPDFRAQVDVPPEPRTPGELKAEQAKAKRRRKAKTETMRKLRAKRP